MERREDRSRDQKVRRCNLGYEDGGRGHEPRNAGGLYNLQKSRKLILL